MRGFFRGQKSDSKRSQESASFLDQKIAQGKTIVDTRGDVYLIESKLGKGGMGTVYKMIEERTGIEHALKVMSIDSLSEMSKESRNVAIARFRSEIDALSRLHNPFILPITDVIQIQEGTTLTLGLVTDLVEGNDLDDEMQKMPNGLGAKRAVEYGAELAIALASLDEADIVHRDIKPKNIFLQSMPNGKKIVRLGDFGIAKDLTGKLPELAIDSSTKFVQTTKDTRLTDAEMVVGTPDFISPEQASGRPLSSRSDLYALGVVLYEMTTGKRLFLGSHYDVMNQHVYNEPPALPPDEPAWLNEIVLKLLSKKPKDRFVSGKEVFVALKEGVKKDFPELLNEEPFMWNFGGDLEKNN